MRGRNHSGGTARLRWFSAASLISLAALASGVPAFAQSNDALTAEFEMVPDSHDGSSEFSVNLRFSEAVTLSADAFRGSLLTITGGTRTGTQRVTPGDDIAWRIDVTPNGQADATITVNANTVPPDCRPNVAPCTTGAPQRGLLEAVSVTVDGPIRNPPPEAAPLTAQFENVPASHDGSTIFKVHLRFSELVDLSAQAFRDGLLTITGGTLHNQRRLGSSIAWEIDVDPAGDGSVVITLPATETCDRNVAPCTFDDRPLSASVSVTVNGPSEVPQVTGPTSFTAAENQTAVAMLTATDADSDAADLTWSIPSGAAGGADGGEFTLGSAGELTFASAKDFENPDDADTNGSYQVTVQVSDGGNLATADLTVTLSDVNDAPTADAGRDQFAIQAGATVTLSGSGSDPDAGDTRSYAWTQTGEPMVTLTNANTATATFTAPSDLTEATTLTFTLRVTDAAGLFDEDSVSVTIGGDAPDPPVITSAASLTAAENATAVATLTATDADSEADDLTWSIPAGDAGGADAGKFTLSAGGDLAFAQAKDFENPDDAGADGSYAVTVEVSDGGLTATANLTVTLTNVNEAPIADAGADQTRIGLGATVTLSGSGTDPDADDTLSYAWTLTNGSAVTLTNPGAATATFTAPAAVTQTETYTFTLRVTDAAGLFHEDTVMVTVPLPLTAQFENAPDRHDGSAIFNVDLRFNQEVRLNAGAFNFGPGLLTITGGSHEGQRRLVRGSSIAWEIDVEPSRDGDVVITLPIIPGCNPNVAPCTPDGRPLTAPASVTVKGPNEAPQVTGPTSFTVAENTTAVATLTATDDELEAAELTWSIPAGAAGGADGGRFTLSAAGELAFAQAKDFESPDDEGTDGSYAVTVQVSDGEATVTANLTVMLTDVNEAPSADAGPDQFVVQPGATLTLSGSGTDADDGDTLSYAWTQTGGPRVTLTGADAAMASFTAPATVTATTTFTFTLRVTDAAGLYDEDSVTLGTYPLTITSLVSFTVAENQTAVARLTATNTDTEAPEPTWSIPAGDAGGADGGKFTLGANGRLAFASAKDFENPDDAGTNGSYEVTVQVSSGDLTATADLTVTLTNVNEAPTADAGADQTGIAAGATVTLSGSGTDPDASDTLSYAWTRTGGPMVTLTGANSATATFTLPSGSTERAGFTFTLRVTDAAGLYHEDTVRVNPLLTAQFENAPATHQGSTDTFSVHLRFSENVDLSATAFTSGLLTITGGARSNQRRVVPGSSIAWEIDVTPAGNADVVITLPVNQTCDRDVAPCTSDGRWLSAPASVTVKGPDSSQGGTNTSPQVTGSTGFTVAENTTAVATLTATDAETQADALTWSIPAGDAGGADGGKFTLSARGVLRFGSAKDFENPDDAGTDGSYAVTVQVSDGSLTATADLTVTLTNVNEAPTAAAGADRTGIAAGATVTLSGSGSDPDAGDVLSYAWTQTGGLGVTLTNANAATATFAVPAASNEPATFTFTLRVTDAGGLHHEDTVTIAAGPVITGATSLTAAENQTAVATLTATNAGTQAATLTWSIPAGAAGGADGGRFTLSSAGVLAFVSAKDFENPDDAGADGSYAVTVQVSDGSLVDTADLTVTLTNVNEAPVANAGPNQFGVQPDDTVTLIGLGSDPESGGSVSFAWTKTGGADVTLTGAATGRASFTVPSDSTDGATFTFTLRVTDTAGLFDEDSVTVTVGSQAPEPPAYSSATSFTVAENTTAVATLTATDADTEADALTWSIPAGIGGGADSSRFRLSAGGVLTFASAKDFENPDDAGTNGSYEVTVQVSDGDLTSTANLTVTLTDVNEAPAANAGSNQFAVQPGATVTLSGSGTDPDADDSLSYAWTQTGEPVVTLTNANTATATFTAPSDLSESTTLRFTLRVTDAAGLYGEDTVTVTVVPQAPVITSAARLTAAENQTAVATLTATDADTETDELTWSIPAGDAGGADGGKFTLSSAGELAFASAKDFENPDDTGADGSYAVTVQVSDGEATAAASLTVTLTDVNEAPTAAAGADQTGVGLGAAVTLNGSGSDPDAGDTLGYAWTQTGEPAVTLTNADAATATFTAPSDVSESTTLTFTLRVTDAGGLFHEDTVTVTVVAQAPVITSAASFTVAENTTAVATLTATDADTESAFLTWSIPAGDAGGADGGKFRLTTAGVLSFASAKDFENPDDAGADGSYAVTVEVSDGALTATADLAVTLTNANEAPTAAAGADQTGVMPGATVTLSGSGSDPDADDTLSYAWTQTGEPAVTLTNANAATATFTAPGDLSEAATLTFTLRVTDAAGLFHEDAVTVSVNPPLTARFENAPTTHDGFRRFSVDLRFSENVELNAAAFTGGLLTITGGTLHSQRMLDSQSNIAWQLNVTPSGNADVVIKLPANQACDADAAPCTADGRQLSASASVTVSARSAPVLTSSTSLTVAENQTTVATLTATDDETPVSDLTWAIPADPFGGADGSKFTLSATGDLAFAEAKDFENADDADTDGVYEVKVQVRDHHGSITASTLEVTLTNVNEEPTADAGADQTGVGLGAAVTLSGSGSDPDAGDTLSYAWTQTGEPAVTLTNGDAATATFTAPSDLTEAVTLTFTLRVTDAAGLFHEDVMTVAVAPQPPAITSAASFTVAENITAVATLTATDADTEADELTWSIPQGLAGGADGGRFRLSATGELTLASAKDFENPDDTGADGSYEVTVEVSDGVLKATANLTVTLTDVNEAPTADAGADQIGLAPGTAVTLSGSGSDPDDGDTVSYAWTQTGEPAVTLTNGDAATATFTAPGDLTEPVTWTFTLRVTDAAGLFHEDTVTVTVQPTGSMTLNVDVIADDDTVNVAEKAAGFSIEGDTGSVGGVTVTVTVGTTELTATSASADPATWSVSVPAAAAYITGTSVAVTVSAAKAGFAPPSAVERTLSIDLVAPTAPTYTAPGSLKVGEAITEMAPSSVTGIEAFSATGLPSGLVIDGTTGAISGTPDAADADTATATVAASDAAGNPATVSITFPAVAKGDQTLTAFSYSASSATFGSTAPTVNAPTGVQTTLSYSATPATVCTVDSATGALTLVGAGACVVTATAAGTDDYNEATATFTVTVTSAGDLELNLDVIADDDTVNVAEKAAGFSIEGDTGTEAGVSVSVQVGTETLTATSADPDTADEDGTATWSVSVPAAAAYITGTSVEVTASASKSGFTAPSDVERTLAVDLTAPTAPTYAAPGSLKVGEAITAISPSGGADTDIDEYTATGLPPGLVIDDTTGAISGTPETAAASTAAATVTVSDTAGNSVAASITFPAVAKGDQTLSGFSYGASSVSYGSTAPTVNEPTGVQTTLSYSVTAEEVCTVDSATGALTLVGAGACVVTATAAGTDDYNEATETFTVTVTSAGDLELNLDVIADDDTINVAEKAAGFSIEGDTGTEAGVSVSVQVGTETVTATSADPDTTDEDGTATWSVSVPAAAAYITGTSVEVTASASKSGFTAPSVVERTLAVDLAAPTAPTYAAPGSLKVGEAITAISPSGGTDTDIDEYTATGLPPGLVIDDTTGAISGTPDAADANTATATVTASDTAGNAVTVDITFPLVAKGDQTLSGFSYSASSVTFGSTAPTVNEPTGVQTTLSYSVTAEEVCTVDSATGALTLVGAGACVVTATAAGTDDYNEATETFTVTVTSAGDLDLNVDVIAGDDTINVAEKAAGFSIEGDTGTEAGVSVSVQVGTETLTATSADPDTTDEDGTATWSVSVPAAAAYITGTSVAVTVSAAKTGFTAPSDVERTLSIDLVAPTAPTYAAPDSLKVGEAITAISPSGGTDTDIDGYSATGLPSGLVIDAATGAISGTPDTADTDTATATVTKSDTAGNAVTVDITFPLVAKGDQTLSAFSYSASSVTFGSAAPTVNAPTGVQTTLSYSVTATEVCTVDSATGALTLVGAGACVVTATAAGTDDYNEATETFTVTVTSAGDLELNVDVIAGDDTVNVAEKAAGFSIEGDTGTEAGVSVSVQVGTETLTATSADPDPTDEDGTATWSVSVPAAAAYITGTSVEVTASASKSGFTAPSDVERTLSIDLIAPTAPGYTAPDNLKVGEAITEMTPSGGTDTDIDGYSATGLPSGLVIDAATGAISGTPDTADADTATATVTKSDTAGNPVTGDITFPAVAKGDQTLSAFSYSASSATFGSTAPTVNAPTGVQTTLSYSATPATVCTVDSATGALTLVGAGACVVTATAAGTDDYNEATETFTVTVTVAGELVLNVDVIAGDDTVNVAEKAAGFSIEGDTGTEAGVSVTVTVGATELTATSADPDTTDEDGTATWSVSVPAAAAYITGTSVAVTASASKTGFTAPSDVERTLSVDLIAPTAPGYTAPDSLKVGEAITEMAPSSVTGIDAFSATGLPSGLVIDDTTGAISGTPDTADANTATATVTASDTAGNAVTVDITFPLVAKGDQTLSAFSYSAASVTYGSTAPSVNEPTGVQTTLSYSVTAEEVCTVGSATGALTLVGVGECIVTATAAGTDDYNEATATFTVTVTSAGDLVLNVDVIAGDDTVNVAEKAAGFSIEGDTGTEAGVSVTLTVGATELTATSADPDPTDEDGTAAWSVSVPAAAAYITGNSVEVTASAAKTGFTAPSDVERTLSIDLVAPTAPGYTTPDSLKVGEAITEMAPSGGTDTDIDGYSVTGLPSGLVIDDATGAISGTPDAADADTATATVTKIDTAGNSATASITFPAVAKGDQTLSAFSYSAASVTYGSTAPTVNEPTGVQTTLSYSVTAEEVCTVDSATGALTLVGVGECVVTATAAGTDDYNEATVTYTVTVAPIGALALNVDVIAGDDTVNIAEKAAGFSIEGNTGTEAGVSVTVTVGATELTATSADPDTADEDGTATWSVSVPAAAAYITGTSVAVTASASKIGYTAPSDVERTLSIDLVAPTAPTYAAPGSLKVGEDITAMTPSGGADTDIDEYAATALPPGLVIDAATGAISGTPDTADANTATATVTVSDTAGNSVTVSITFPAGAKGDQTLSGFGYSAASVTYGSTVPSVNEPTGVQTTLSYSAEPAEVCTVDSATGALTLVEAGSCVVTATAAGTDDYNEATVTYTVTVVPVGTLVLNVDVIAGDDTINVAEKAAGFSIEGNTGSDGEVSVTVTVGTTELTATSADADPATWSVNVPADAAYITGTSVAVTVSASKTGFTAASDVARTLAVDLTAPTAPTYVAPASLKVGETIAAMTPSGGADTDIDGYTATGLPPGLVIDDATGAISGTPETADASTAAATVTVSDTAGNSVTASITFPAVAKGDQTLSGFGYSAASVTYGSTVPTVSEPAGVQTSLSYSATPATVCTVDSATGALSLVEAGSCVVTATAAGTDDYNEATVTYTVTVVPVGTLVLNMDVIAGDGTINIAEKAAGFVIEGDTGAEAGVSVSVRIGAGTLTATSVDAGGTATWSVSVPANATYIAGTAVAVTVLASKTGFTAADTVARALNIDLVAPGAPTYTAPASLQVGEAIAAMTPSGGSGTDIDGYSSTGFPSGLAINGASGTISGTPDTATASTATATVSVIDTAGNSVTLIINFPAVARGDQTLSGFGYSAASVTLGSAAPTLSAPTGVQTTLSYSATPAAVCTVDSATGALTLAAAGACVVTATAASTADYNEGTATFTVTVKSDSNVALLTVDSAVLDEDAGATAVTVTATLDGAPRAESATITVSVGASDDAAVAGTDYESVDDLSLTIPSGQTSATATFTLTPTDDRIDERVEAVSIVGTTELEGFEITGTSVTIADNDERGVTISPAVLAVNEGGNGSYTVVLLTEPTGTVTVTPSVGGGSAMAMTPSAGGDSDATTGVGSDVTVSAALTFTAADWNQPQTVTVSAAEDADAANDTATIGHAVAGADYGANGVTADDVAVTVDDNETAVTLTVDPAALDEGAPATTVTVTATLDGSPRAGSTALTVSVGADGDAAVAGTDYEAVDDLTLTILPGQASGTATFTLTPLEDSVDEQDKAVSITATTELEGIEVTGTTVTIADDDQRGVTISPTSLTVTEGGNETYSVVLTSEPTGTVTVTPSVSGDSDITVTPSASGGADVTGSNGSDVTENSGSDATASAALTFTAADWNQPQTVTVSAAEDDDAANDTATIEHAVAGADYGATAATAATDPNATTTPTTVTATAVTVTIEDNETAVTLTLDPTALAEDAGATTVTVTGTLDGEPRDESTAITVSVGASGDAAAAGTDYAAVDDLTLTIPSGQASGTATFTLTPLVDSLDEPDEAVSIAGTTEIDGLEVIGTTLAIADNNERGVTVSPAVLTFAEGGSATYTVVLDAEPTATVTLTPSAGGSPDLSFEPSSLTFTTSDWNTAQTLTVSAAEDDDNHHDSATVSHAAQGGDYASLVDGEVSVTVADNEVASQDMLAAQVGGVSATATATHVELNWTAATGETVLGYLIEASYDGGANWATAGNAADATDTSYRHDAGLNFSETRFYRVSAQSENGAGPPSVVIRTSATATAGGLTAVARSTEDLPDQAPPAMDLCWIPQGVDAGDLSDIAIAWTPVDASGSPDPGDLAWQQIGSGSTQVQCDDGIGFRVTSLSANQRYAFRMRARHDGAWLVSNGAHAVLADVSRPLRAVVTAGASGLSGDTPLPDLLCRTHDDPATREDEEGAFFVTVGFTTAGEEYLRYEPVHGFDPATGLTLGNATAQRVDLPHHALLGYRVRITPEVWGDPVTIGVPSDVVTHAETGVGNRASGEFRLETSAAEDCDTPGAEPVRRAQATAASIEEDGDRNGEWAAFEPVRVTLRYDEPVRVDTADGVPGVTVTLGASPDGGTADTGQSTDSGTADTGQSTDDAAATQVTALFSHVAHGDTLVFEYLVTEADSPVGEIVLLADSLALNGGRIDSFSGPAVDLAHPEAATVDGRIVQPGLTAGWSAIPAAHEGSGSAFDIRLQFSEDVELVAVIGEQDLLEHAFTVTGGTMEAIGPSRDRQGEYLADEWTMSIRPDSDEPVTIAPVADRACDAAGTICTVDGRPLAEAPSVAIHRIEQTVSVADAEVGEGPGAVLDFEVTLARSADQPVTVDYETANGTATAGADFEAVSGTLSFETGQTTATVRVPVIDDSHNEGEEDFTLILSNAAGASIGDGEALGIIVNTDPMPGAWLSRFGRAASDHVAQAVARRLERGADEEHLTVGSLRLDSLFAGFGQPDERRAATAPARVDPGASRGLPGSRDLLLGSSFFYTNGGDEDSPSAPWAAWGEAATTRFNGSDGALSVEGEVSTAILGLDKRYGRWLVGSTLSLSEGEGAYGRAGAGPGVMQSTLTSLNPYAHFELNESTDLWGVFGYGTGRLRLTPHGAASAIETDLSNRMAAFGGRGLLSVRTGSAGRFELALRSDALLTHTDSEAVRGLAGATGATSRVRLILEGSGSLSVLGGTLRPTVEAGLRYDGGDAETGAGLEIGGGLAHNAGRLSLAINARGLLAHEAASYEEWGFSGSLAYRPGKGGRGLSMKLGSAWGVTGSGVQSMWSRANASGLATGTAMDAAQRFQAEFGYGLDGPKGRALWVPFVGAEAGHGGNRSLRLGVKLTSGSHLEAGLEIGRRDSAREEPGHVIEIGGKFRW